MNIEKQQLRELRRIRQELVAKRQKENGYRSNNIGNGCIKFILFTWIISIIFIAIFLFFLIY